MQPPLRYDIKDIQQLYASYLPFVKNGALFIPTASDEYQLGDPVHAIICLPQSKAASAIYGPVVWLNTPSESMRPEGIAIQLSSDKIGQILKKAIEQQLSASVMSDSGQATYTM